MKKLNEVVIRINDGEGNYENKTIFVTGTSSRIAMNKVLKLLEKEMCEEEDFKEQNRKQMDKTIKACRKKKTL